MNCLSSTAYRRTTTQFLYQQQFHRRTANNKSQAVIESCPILRHHHLVPTKVCDAVPYYTVIRFTVTNCREETLALYRGLTMYAQKTVVPQPPYYADLAPADFFLFPKLKSSLKGRRFQTEEGIEENSIRDLRAIPQNTLQDAFQNWEKRWARCIESGRKHFEGDKFD